MTYLSRQPNQVGEMSQVQLRLYLWLQCLDLNNSYKTQQEDGEPDPVEEEDGEYVPRHEELLERAERASLETSAVYVDPNSSTNLWRVYFLKSLRSVDVHR